MHEDKYHIDHKGTAMKKRTLPHIIALFCLSLAFSACGPGEPGRITGEVEDMQQGGAITVDNGSTGSADTPTVGDTAAAPAATGYVFIHNGVTIVIDADFAPVRAALGEPRSYFEAASCAFEGLDKTYGFSGFEVDTYPQADADFISAIVLRDDTVATPEGIRIGSTRADMEAAYGAGHENDSGQIIHQKDHMRLAFILDGDMVMSIEYQSMVLDD